MHYKTVAVDYDETIRDSETNLPVAGSQDAIRRWVSEGRNVYILTARPTAEEGLVRSWLHDHGYPDLPIICTGGEYLDKLGYEWDALVDDSVGLLDAYLDNPPRGLLVHFHARIGWIPRLQWEQGLRGGPNREPVDYYDTIAMNWDDVERILRND